MIVTKAVDIFELILIFLSSCILLAESAKLSIGTYNLWNVMFNWEVRLQHMADMIQEHDLDVVVFQEVRLKCGSVADKYSQSCVSQLEGFKWLLPEYRWILARPAGSVTQMKSSINHGWHYEGLGIISRKPIVSSKVIHLKQTSFRDLNKRIALHVKLKVGAEESGDTVDIFIVHLSYDPKQQCHNVNDIVKFIDGAELKHSVVLGDFNVYQEVSPAIGHFVGLPRGQPECPKADTEKGSPNPKLVNFQDVWLTSGKAHKEGLSFSNMPTPGPQSRPDRILVSKEIQVSDTGLVGLESTYWKRYHLSATQLRVKSVFTSAYHSFQGIVGYPCSHDCGPHGSCRCGVCINGGNQNNCLLPDCPECSITKFVIFILSSLFILVVLLFFLLSVIRILVVSAKFNQNDIMDILGYRCCLFNRQLFQFNFDIFPRRFKIKCFNALRLYNLPPVLAALASLLLLCLGVIIMYVVFGDTLHIVQSILPEEKFPSDHKMVFAKLDLS